MINYYDEVWNTLGSYAFIAIDFSNKFAHVYEEIIYPAVVDAGMLPIRSDEIISESENVSSQIRQLIQNSRIFIADISFVRQESYANIFYELGIAIALNRPVVILSQDEKIPFDIQHLRIIKYELSQMGKLNIRKELTLLLQKNINSSELILRKMLIYPKEKNYIVYGYATKEHISRVFPEVDQEYDYRLKTISSEASGISKLTVAFQKIAWSMAQEKFDIISVNGHRAPKEIFSCGNIYIFGGPGANPLFETGVALAQSIYKNALSILHEQLSNGKRRYYISKDNEMYPPEQYNLYERKRDIGFVMRFPNPCRKDSIIVIAAGIRTYGTEGAIKLLVTPSLISRLNIYKDLKNDRGFWALLEVSYGMNEPAEQLEIIESEILRER